MPSFHNVKTLPYHAEEIYKIVLDIEKYPEFLPWCKYAKIVEASSHNNLQADLLINFKSFFEKYRSDVKYGKSDSDGFFVEAVAIDGPFKYLTNSWKFRDLKSASDKPECEVSFAINFEFNSILLSKMIGAIFEQATGKMMKAFEDRAQNLSARN